MTRYHIHPLGTYFECEEESVESCSFCKKYGYFETEEEAKDYVAKMKALHLSPNLSDNLKSVEANFMLVSASLSKKPEVRLAVAKKGEQQRTLMNDEDIRVRCYVADKCTNADLLKQMVYDTSAVVRAVATWRLTGKESELRDLPFSDKFFLIELGIAHSVFATDKSFGARSSTLKNTEDESIIRILADDPTSDIRKDVAFKTNNMDTLNLLALDYTFAVKSAVLERCLQDGIMEIPERLLRDDDRCIRTLSENVLLRMRKPEYYYANPFLTKCLKHNGVKEIRTFGATAYGIINEERETGRKLTEAEIDSFYDNAIAHMREDRDIFI